MKTPRIANAAHRPPLSKASSFLALGLSPLFLLLLLPARQAGAREEATAPPKTVITGARMTLLRKGEAVEFSGGVKLKRGSDFLSADRMVSEEKTGLIEAYGRVYLKRDSPEEGLRWEGWGDKGAYETKASSGTLRGGKKPARLKRTPLAGRRSPAVSDGSSEAELEIQAESLGFFQAASTPAVTSAWAEGNVEVVSREKSPAARETRVWASHAFFDGPAGSVRFWNGGPEPLPRALQTQDGAVRDLTGRVITYFAREERLVVEERARAVLYSPGGTLAPAR
ncbi:MAG: LptA/OstA family protein [Elusimicrobiota bacterium]